MKNLKDEFKRGRPDIIHFCLLAALGTPLNRENLLRTYIHTYKEIVINISQEVRLPKNHNRFVGLMEQLFMEGRVPPGKRALLSAEKKGLKQLIDEISPTKVVALTSHGESKTVEKVCQWLAEDENPMVLIGAYPYGPMKKKILKQVDKAVSIDPKVLDAWIVTSRLIYQYEVAIGLQERLFTHTR
jgi:rRNA small subunit pseudouridine methyltransferase Nep1